MKILFVSGVAPIVGDVPDALALFGETLGLELPRSSSAPATVCCVARVTSRGDSASPGCRPAMACSSR
jgi:hypothetical protein